MVDNYPSSLLIKNVNPCLKYDFTILDVLGEGNDGIVLDVKLKNKRLLHMHENVDDLTKMDSFVLKIMTTDESLISFQKIQEVTTLMGNLNIGPKVIDSYICYYKCSDNKDHKHSTLFILMTKLDGTLENILDIALMPSNMFKLFKRTLVHKTLEMGKYFIHESLNFRNIGYTKKIVNTGTIHGAIYEPYIFDYNKINENIDLMFMDDDRVYTGLIDYENYFFDIFDSYEEILDVLNFDSSVFSSYKINYLLGIQTKSKIHLDINANILTMLYKYEDEDRIIIEKIIKKKYKIGDINSGIYNAYMKYYENNKNYFLKINRQYQPFGSDYEIIKFKNPPKNYKLCDLSSEGMIDYEKYSKIFLYFDGKLEKTDPDIDEIFINDILQSRIINVFFFENTGKITTKNPKYIMC